MSPRPGLGQRQLSLGRVASSALLKRRRLKPLSNMSASKIKWKPISLGQYICEKKLVRLLYDKAKVDGLVLKEKDFESAVCSQRTQFNQIGLED